MYTCEKCNYNTKVKGNYNKHLLSKKHIKKHANEVINLDNENNVNDVNNVDNINNLNDGVDGVGGGDDVANNIDYNDKIQLKKDINIDNIFHLSDIHIRLNSRFKEYNEVFEKTYNMIRKLVTKSSLIVLTGDILHSKTVLSPECVNMTYNFLLSLTKICDVILISGNHDANLANPDRQDSLSAVIRNIDGLYYLKNTGAYCYGNIVFGVSSVLDGGFINGDKCRKMFNCNKNYYIGLYHGPVNGSKNSTGYKLSGVSQDIFTGYDYVMLGDIHQFQYLNKKKTMAYASSLIQQNHGESLENHGFLHWQLNSGKSVYHSVPNDYAYVTIKNNDEFKDNFVIPPKANIRYFSNIGVTDNNDIIKLKNKYPKSKIIVINEKTVEKGCENINTNCSNQNDLIKEYIKSENIGSGDVEYCKKILEINEKYNKIANEIKNENDEKNENNVFQWKILKMECDNMFSFNEGQVIDFSGFNGIVGIFAPNHYGKSAIFDIILFCLYEKTSKTNTRTRSNVININKEEMKCKLTLDINGVIHTIERRNVGKKFVVDFNKIIDGKPFSVNGTSHIQTNKIIEKIVGKYDDFISTSLSLQSNNNSFVELPQSNRKDYLNDILGLKIFEKLFEHSKKDLKNIKNDLRLVKKQSDKYIEMHGNDYDNQIKELENKLSSNMHKFDELSEQISYIKAEIDSKEVFDIPICNMELDVSVLDEHLNKYDMYKNERMDIKFDAKKRDEIIAKMKKNIKKKDKLLKKLNTSSNIIDDIIDINGYVKNGEKLEENKTSLQKEIEKLDEQISKFDDNEYSSLCEKLDKYNEQKRNDDILIEVYNKQIEDFKNHKYDPKCEYCCSNNVVKDGSNAKIEIDKIEKKNLIKKIDELKKQIENMKYEKYVENKDTLKTKSDELEKMEKYIVINNENIETMEKINELNEKINKKQNNIDTMNEASNRINILDSSILKYEYSIKKINEEIRNRKIYELHKNKNETTSVQIDSLNSEIEKLRNEKMEIKQHNMEIKYEIKNLNKYKKEYDDIANKKNELEKEFKPLNDYVNIVKKDGLPMKMLNKIIPKIEKLANQILEPFVDFRLSIFIDDNNIEVNICYENSQWDVNGCSGFEKFIVGLVFRIVIQNISNISKSNFIGIDEGWGCFDEKNLGKVDIIFGILKSYYDFVLIISHIEKLKSDVDTTITIKKVDGYSKIVQ